MYERFRKEKIVEAETQRLRNAMGMMDTIVTFQIGALHARHTGCYREFQDGADLELDCEQSLFFFRLSKSGARARERRSRETRQTRAAAISHERGHLRVSRFARRTTEKIETARSLIWNRHTDQ